MKMKCKLKDMHQLALYFSVKQRLFNLNHDSVLGAAIHIGMQRNLIVETLKTIRSQAKDCHSGVESVVGEELLSDILKLKL